MPTVFVDTAAWIALLNTSDVYHARASKVMADLRRQQTQLVTTEFILLEVADALSAQTSARKPLRSSLAFAKHQFWRSCPQARISSTVVGDCTPRDATRIGA